MERLTYKRVNGIQDGYWSPMKKQDLVDALAAYENTDLDPEQIRELKERDTAQLPEEFQDAFGDTRLICPNCRNSVINYVNRSQPPQFCMICGQRLELED